MNEMPSVTEVLREEKKQAPALFDRIASTYDFLNHFLSFGVDYYWRWVLVRTLKGNPAFHLQVLDLATGTGDLALGLLKRDIVGEVTGLDPSSEMLKEAKRKKDRHPRGTSFHLVQGVSELLPFPDQSFDVVTLSFGPRNFPHLEASLREIRRVLRPQGQVLILEFGRPKNLLLQKLYAFYLQKVLPTLGNWLSRDHRAYRYLQETVQDFPYGDEFARILKTQVGGQVSYKSLTGGISYLYCISPLPT